MPKFKLEVPITAHFIIEVEAADEDEALDAVVKPPTLCFSCAPKLQVIGSDAIDVENIRIIGVKN